MSDRFIQARIRALPLFQNLPDDQLALVVNAFQVLRFEPGSLVFQQGQPTQGMYVFVSGRGMLTARGADGVEHRVGVVEAGQTVGQDHLFVDGQQTATLRVVESSIILFLARRQMEILVSQQPALRYNLTGEPGQPPPPPVFREIFKGQQPDETVLHIFRRHWWVLVKAAWLPLLLLTAGVVVSVLLLPTAGWGALGIGVVALLLAIGIIAYNYLEWQDDAVIITDRRVVRIWNNLLALENNISEVPLERVLEVSYEIPVVDLFARVFQYATVFIKTAGEAGNLKVDMIHDPARLQALIFANRDLIRRRAEHQSRQAIRAEIEQVFGVPEATVGTPNKATAAVPPVPPPPTGGGLMRTRFMTPDNQIVYRRHWLNWFRGIIVPVMVMVGAVVMIFVLLAAPSLQGLAGLGVLVCLALIGVGAVWAYLSDWDWRNDMLVLGDDTITITHRRPLWLQNEVDQIRLTQVDNVVSDTRGLINNIINRGDIRLSLVGADREGQKVFHHVQDPQTVQQEISTRQSAVKAQQQQSEAQRQRAQIAEYLSVYHEAITQRQQSANPAPQPAPPPPSTTPWQQEGGEAPPQPTRDAIRPPRIPRMRPGDLP